MARFFISYRRDDSKHAVGRLYAVLKRHVRNPKRDIFMDVDAIPRGVNFVQFLEKQVAQCEIMLAIIGPRWVSITDRKTGTRRLDDPNDFVRIEIAAALKRGIPVVPVILDDTAPLGEADLPDDLKELVWRNAEWVKHESFDYDVARLIRKLPRGGDMAAQTAPSDAGAPPRVRAGSSLPVMLAAVVVVVGALAGAAWIFRPGATGESPAISDGNSLKRELATEAGTASSYLANLATVPREIVTDEVDKTPLTLASIPSATFSIGSPAGEAGRDEDEAQTRVSASALLAMTHEVTVEQFRAFARETDRYIAPGCVNAPAAPQAQATLDTSLSWRDPGFPQADDHPVVCVNTSDIEAYVSWLASKTGKSYRLPTEAEWEHLARAGTLTPYSTGDVLAPADAWTNSGDGVQAAAGTAAVISGKANGFGLYGVHGNVWEWTASCYAEQYAAPSSEDCRTQVVRGGSWNDQPVRARSANRSQRAPDLRANDLGFRLVREPG